MAEVEVRSQVPFVAAALGAGRDAPLPGPDVELLARARGLYDLLRGNAVAADEERLIPRENMEAVRDAGLMRCWVPKSRGGFQSNLQTQLGIVAELSRACASTGWTVSNMIACTWCASLYDEETQDEVFGDGPDPMICGVLTPAGTAEAVSGGYMIGGSWGVASGCQFADWAELTVPLPDSDEHPANVGYVLVPMSELTIKDTWFTMGMRGTASNSLIGEGIFVPERRVLRLLDETGAMNPDKVSAVSSEPPYTTSFGTEAALTQIGTPIGLAQAALETALEQIPKRGIAYTRYLKQAEAVVTHVDLAQAAATIDAAIAVATRAAQQADDAAQRGVALDELTLARIRMDAGSVARNLRTAVDSLLLLCGTSSVASRNFLQQVFRDTSTVTLHGLVQPSIMAENYGRALLGLPPDVTFV